jgi:hypothetical protein
MRSLRLFVRIIGSIIVLGMTVALAIGVGYYLAQLMK